jgi:glycerophosphoryl diester phosphodiesterase/predicted amidohydrolase
VPALARSAEENMASHRKYCAPLLEKAKETARRCNAVVFINMSRDTETGLRNSTYAIDRQGNVVGYYDKEHLTHGEEFKTKKDAGYTYRWNAPTVIEIDGVRYGFLTCYDFYFYENFAQIARENVDVIIGCSHQRSDLHSALETMSKFCAYNTNAYVVRASVSMDEHSEIGGASMIVHPRGEVLVNMGSRVGMACAELDPHEKYYKPAGFGNPLAAHYEYIEKGRRPWKYRPAGSAIVEHDDHMPYPRICAHRGFSTVAPENSMAAFGAAVALGAEEIELDLWYTKDGEIVSIHDDCLERVSDGVGHVYDYTYEELLRFDFGVKFGDAFRGLKILKFEDILKKFACHCVMNIHIKTVNNTVAYDEALLQRIVGLIHAYDCEKYVYFTTGNRKLLGQLAELAPDLARCAGAGDDPWEIVEKAIEYGCKKVQLFQEYYSQEMIDRAHANGIRCNYFYCDDAEQAKKLLAMGIDTILTNDYQRISNALRKA